MRERNPGDFYEVRKAQLKDSTPILGKFRRKKVIEEICNARFEGWINEKIAAVIEGVKCEDNEVRQIAETYLLSLEYNQTDKELVIALCDHFLENKHPRILHIIRKKKFMPKFSSIFKTLEFYSSIYGPESTKKAVDKLSIEDSFQVLINSDVEELKKMIVERLQETLNKDDIPEIMRLFKRDIHSCYCDFIDKFFNHLSFKEKIFYIQLVPNVKGYDGNRETYTSSLIDRLDQYIKKHPETMDSYFALQEYERNPYNHWLIDLLKNNRDILGIKNELFLCNYFKEYNKVRNTINEFSLVELCQHFTDFVGTPIDCMFQQRLRSFIRKQNYSFDFNMIRDFFPYIEETLKLDIFKMLKNYSSPTFMGFLLYQINKISSYSEEEQKIFINELIPYYIPMFFRLPASEQERIINELPSIDFACLDFLINQFLKIRSEEHVVMVFEKLLKIEKFTDEERAVIIEIIINQRVSIIEKSDIIKRQKLILDAKVDKLNKLLAELEKQCSRRYLRDDTTGHNAEIDRKRALLRKEIQKIDLEKSIEILLPHYNEKNYRLKRDIRTILENTQVGYKILVPIAFTSGMEDKDLRDFSVYLLEKRIQPYVPFKPDIEMTYDHYKYVEFFMSEQDPIFKNLARLIRNCNILVKRH